MELRQLTLRPRPGPLKGFFRLPIELRNRVYAYCLLESPKWEKRHDAACDYTPRDCKTSERPPFTQELCHCARRKAVGLLGVNRQIHYEAAPLFWSRNVFGWTSFWSFTSDVTDNLRDEYRVLIRHVSIIADHQEWDLRRWGLRRWGDEDRVSNRYTYENLWVTVRKCTGLRTLELRCEYLEGCHEYVTTLRDYLPHLQELRLSNIRGYDLTPPNAPWLPYNQRPTLFFRYGRAVDLTRIIDLESCREAMRDFTTNFLVHTRYAIETELLRLPQPPLPTTTTTTTTAPAASQPANHAPAAAAGGPCARFPALLSPPPTADSPSGPWRLPLRDGTLCDIRVYGLPITRATRQRHARERMRADADCRAAGRPTARDDKLRAQVDAIHCARRRDRAASGTWRKALLAARREQREAESRFRKEQAAEDKAREREGRERRLQEAREARGAERKRRGVATTTTTTTTTTTVAPPRKGSSPSRERRKGGGKKREIRVDA